MKRLALLLAMLLTPSLAHAISCGELPTANTLDGSEILCVEQDNESRKTTTADVIDVFGAAAPDYFKLESNPIPTPTCEEALFYWDNEDKAFSVCTGSAAAPVLQVGQEVWIRVVNKTGLEITDGQVVYIDTAQGNRPTIQLADASTEATSHVIIAVATHDIADNEEGYVTTHGYVRGYNTSTFGAGDDLYLSSVTPGELTNNPANAQPHFTLVAVALNSLTNGDIFVSPQIGYELSELHDIDFTTVDGAGLGDLLWHDGTNWKAGIETLYLDGSKWATYDTSLNNSFIGAAPPSTLPSNGNNIFIGSTTSGVLTSGQYNYVMGVDAGAALTGAASRNVFIGAWAGEYNETGNANVCIGAFSCNDNVTGATNTAQFNVAIGEGAGYYFEGAEDNVLLGHSAGASSGAGGDVVDGARNVFIGYQAGYASTPADPSDRLFIDSSTTDTPLVEGDFSSDWVKINGDFEVTGDFTVGAYERHMQITAGSAVTGPSAPTSTTYNTVVRCLEFDNDSEEAFLTIEIPSDWEGDSDMLIEMDWIPNDASMVDTNTVKWDIQYRSIAQNEDSDGTLTAATATYTSSGATDQGTMIHTAVTLDWDDANNPIVVEDHLYIQQTRDMTGDSFGGGACITAWEVLYNSISLPRAQ